MGDSKNFIQRWSLTINQLWIWALGGATLGWATRGSHSGLAARRSHLGLVARRSHLIFSTMGSHLILAASGCNLIMTARGTTYDWLLSMCISFKVFNNGMGVSMFCHCFYVLLIHIIQFSCLKNN